MAIFKIQQVKYTKIPEFKTEPNWGNYSCEHIYFFKQQVDLFTYHLEDLRVPLMVRVPQFGNHCCMRWKLVHVVT